MSYIEVSGVNKKYKMGEVLIKAVEDISFTIEKGELVVILGPSGAGKTTILNILGGMDLCDTGNVVVDGNDITNFSDNELVNYRRYDIGFVFQFYNLVHSLTALENVELANQICKNPLDSEQTLELVGLKDRLNNFPAQLSGGEQQRVAIARALAKNPKLLLCDEPTGALDSITGGKVLEILQRVSHELGMTTIIITHNTEISRIANKIIKMRNGKIDTITINTPVSAEEVDW
jgi:putative ABC transport system ATP-binding protein